MNEDAQQNDFTQKDLMKHLLNAAQHAATREELQATKSELKGDIAELRTELKGDIAELRTELKGDIAELRTELKGDIAGLRTEFNALADKTDTLRADLITMEYKLTVRLGGIMVAGIGVIAALTKL